MGSKASSYHRDLGWSANIIHYLVCIDLIDFLDANEKVLEISPKNSVGEVKHEQTTDGIAMAIVGQCERSIIEATLASTGISAQKKPNCIGDLKVQNSGLYRQWMLGNGKILGGGARTQENNKAL